MEASNWPIDVIVFCGIPASGKTTFQEKFFPDHQIVSKDRMGRSHRNEKQERAIGLLLANRRSIVVDNNNTERIQRARIIELVRALGADSSKVIFKLYYFGNDIEGALQRSRERNITRKKRKQVPDFVVRGFLNHLDVPTVDEEFDEIYHVSIAKTPGDFDVRRVK